jgi:transcriptional regulator with XRE-family HTH domain
MTKTSDRFKEVRDSLGLTQAEMGNLLGVSTPTIQRWESGEPALDENKRFKLQKIGINPASILIGEPEDFILEQFTIKQARDLARAEINGVLV